MVKSCNESDSEASPGPSTPLLASMSDGDNSDLVYTGSQTRRDSPSRLQQRNVLGLQVDVEKAKKRVETTFSNPENQKDITCEETNIENESRLRCSLCSNVSLIVYILVILFGSGSWIAVNGVWVELPLLVPRLPESWNLPSYLSVTIQLANIGPLIFFIAYTFYPDKVKEKPVVFLIILVGTVSCFLLAFFWHRTSWIADVEHSTALLGLMFLLSFVDCTSSVVFLPFMALFPQEYMTAFYIGEGFSGLFPSLVSLGQGAGEYYCTNVTVYVNKTINGTVENVTEWKMDKVDREPNFPVEDFFFFLFAMMAICGIAFTLLNYLPLCKKLHLLNGNNGANRKEPNDTDKLVKDVQHTTVAKPVAISKRSPGVKEVNSDKQECKPLSSTNDSPCSPTQQSQSDHELVTPCHRKRDGSSVSSAIHSPLGLPDVTDGDDSVFEHDPQKQRSLLLRRQSSVKPSRRRTLTFGTMDFSFSSPDIDTIHQRLDRVEDGSLTTSEEVSELTKADYVFLLFLIGVINALSNGVLPSVQTYSTLPYGSLVYSLAVRLANVVNPVACFVAFFLPTKSFPVLGIVTACGTGTAVYILILAAMSPSPPLVGITGGDFLTVFAWLLVTTLFSYAKVLIAMILRDDGRKGLIWCGAITQVGSTVGAVAMFVLVNVLKLFASASYC